MPRARSVGGPVNIGNPSDFSCRSAKMAARSPCTSYRRRDALEAFVAGSREDRRDGRLDIAGLGSVCPVEAKRAARANSGFLVNRQYARRDKSLGMANTTAVLYEDRQHRQTVSAGTDPSVVAIADGADGTDCRIRRIRASRHQPDYPGTRWPLTNKAHFDSERSKRRLGAP